MTGAFAPVFLLRRVLQSKNRSTSTIEYAKLQVGGSNMENESKSNAVDPRDPSRDVMYQVSLLQGLTYGE